VNRRHENLPGNQIKASRKAGKIVILLIRTPTAIPSSAPLVKNQSPGDFFSEPSKTNHRLPSMHKTERLWFQLKPAVAARRGLVRYKNIIPIAARERYFANSFQTK